MKDLRQSRKLVLFIVFVALLLDNMLMTVVGKGQFYYNKLQTKTVLEQNTQLGNLIPLLDNELVHFGISRTLTFQVWQFPIPVLILSFLLLQAILHGDNKGDCLHAPLFLPWCPWSATVKCTVPSKGALYRGGNALVPLLLKTKRIQACGCLFESHLKMRLSFLSFFIALQCQSFQTSFLNKNTRSTSMEDSSQVKIIQAVWN